MRTKRNNWIGCLGLFIAAFILAAPVAGKAQGTANPFDPRYYINLVEYSRTDEIGRNRQVKKILYQSDYPGVLSDDVFQCQTNKLYLCLDGDTAQNCPTSQPAFTCVDGSLYQLEDGRINECKDAKLVPYRTSRNDREIFVCGDGQHLRLRQIATDPTRPDPAIDFRNIFLVDKDSTMQIELNREAIQKNHVSGEISIYAYLISGSGDNRPLSVENYTVIQEKSAVTSTTSLSTSSISDLDSKHIAIIKDNMKQMQDILQPIDAFWDEKNKKKEMDDAFKKLEILIDNNVNEAALIAGSYNEEPESFDMGYIMLNLNISPSECIKNRSYAIYQEVCDASGNDGNNTTLRITPKTAIKIHGLYLRMILYYIQEDYYKYQDEKPSDPNQKPTPLSMEISGKELKNRGIQNIRDLYRYSNPNYIAVYVDHIFRKQVFSRLKDGKIDLSREKLNHGDFLIITVTNKVDENTSFQFSWNLKITAAGFYRSLDPSIVFVRTMDYNTKYTKDGEAVNLHLNEEWKAAPGGTLLWRYRTQKNPLWEQLLVPGFGVNLSILDFDPEQDVELGAALVLSEFDNAIVFGYGWNLSVPGNPAYAFIGFNFLSSINAFQKYGEYYTNYQAKPPGGGGGF